MITSKSVHRALASYRKYISSGREARDFTTQELTAVRSAALEDGCGEWSLITCSLMYGYVKGYRRAMRDRKHRTR